MIKLYSLISFFIFFVQCKEKQVENITTTSNFVYNGRFSTNDKIIFTLDKTEVKLFPNEQERIEINLKNLNKKLEIRDHNNCNMEAVGTSVYLFTNSENQNLKIILIEDYQDILTGSMFAIVINKNKLVKTYRLCNSQYNYEKYNINDILTINEKDNEFIFNFDPKKLINKKNELRNIKTTSNNGNNVEDYIKKGYEIIDEIDTDLDGDLDNDKIYMTSSKDEITNSQILIFKNNNNSFLLWAKNDSLPVLGKREYKKTVTKNKYFTIEYIRDIEDKYNQNNYLTFKYQDGKFMLHKFSQDIYNAKTNKNLPLKIWSEKDFGKINFEDVTDDFLLKLR